MAKKNVQPANEEVEVIVPDVDTKEEVVENQESTTESKVETKSKKKEKKAKTVEAKEESSSSKKEKDSKNSKDKNKNKNKQKKERKSLKKKATEVLSELKKVSKPTFGKVVKNTCVVIVVVTICTLLLFGMDKLFSLIYDLLLP